MENEPRLSESDSTKVAEAIYLLNHCDHWCFAPVAEMLSLMVAEIEVLGEG